MGVEVGQMRRCFGRSPEYVRVERVTARAITFVVVDRRGNRVPWYPPTEQDPVQFAADYPTVVELA